MKSIFYQIDNSSDEEENNENELNSIEEMNYIEKKHDNLFKVYNGKYEHYIKEKNFPSYEEVLKIFSFKNKDNDDEEQYLTENKLTTNTISIFPFTVINQKKRGKVSLIMKKTHHLSTDFDNLQRKIQVHFFTFIINLSNDVLKAVFGQKTSYNFKQIDYQLKKLISHKFVNKLHSFTIKDLLNMKISPKNKNHSQFTNKDTLNKVCKHSKLLDNFFDLKYLEFFNKFYFNKEKGANKIVFEGKEIMLSNKTKNFSYLLKKYENYQNLLIDSAKSVYFYGYDTLIGNNSFITLKEDI